MKGVWCGCGAVLGGNFRSFGEGQSSPYSSLAALRESPRLPCLPAGSLFESLYEGLKVEDDVEEVPSVAGPVSQSSPGPGCGMAVEGLMEMWKESQENERLILELAGAVDFEMGE
jgi:hypothetical protein